MEIGLFFNHGTRWTRDGRGELERHLNPDSNQVIHRRVGSLLTSDSRLVEGSETVRVVPPNQPTGLNVPETIRKSQERCRNAAVRLPRKPPWFFFHISIVGFLLCDSESSMSTEDVCMCGEPVPTRHRGPGSERLCVRLRSRMLPGQRCFVLLFFFSFFFWFFSPFVSQLLYKTLF